MERALLLHQDHSSLKTIDMKSKTFVSENIRAILAVIIVVTTFYMYILLITREIKLADTITSVILGILSAQTAQVLSYYFGASKPHTDPAAETKTVEISTTEKKAGE